jgi:uncharacterized protein YbjT (DUF2867 family)
MKILFIGATGMLGKPVALELINQGFDMTLFGRDEAKMKSLFPGAKTKPGDVMDKAALVNAMTGMDAVYCNLSIAQSSKEKDPQPEREGVDNILTAAKETAVKRIAYLSSLVHQYEGMNHFSWWAFHIKASAVKKIKASGIPFTIFYPSTFMETYPYQVMRGNKIATLGHSVAPMWFIAADDYAKQVAKSFQILPTENREYAVQGTEAFTFSQANKVFIENYKKARLGVAKAPMGLMKFIGNFSPKFNYVWHICEALNKYPEKFESENTWKELGKPAITLAQFASQL